ncbi:uncharacterized protein LOC120358419 [Solenopsis invicta]|uniref:uncharacterized protein LOC120358419 n=1 Tax=Solenopsis invicta TaxID=13686 RepID=UPI00193EC016|nr:uncharacterized protein LOC120358419 [Solenopsis invicta]
MRRFTLEEKMFCIGLYRRSRSSYSFLSKYLLCPSITTLNKQLQRIPFNAGCNMITFKYLKLVAKEVDPRDLNVVLLWEEMSLKPAVHYDKKRDIIIGFEDWGMRRKRNFADHAILFYIRCLASGNHMALGYGFCESATRSIQLVQCIKQWLNMIVKCGFKPVATVCDQGGPNVAAINMLIKEANEKRIKQHKIPENTFIVSNCEVVPLYDYVHLQKGVRNNLLTKDLVVDKFKKESERQFASWNDIITVYEIDKYSFLKQRQMPKLTNKHIFPNCIPKMRVKYATQVISHTVANFIDVILTWNQGKIL